MSMYLIDEAERLEPSTGPWMVLVGDDRIGEDWLIASFGMETDGQNRHVTTDQVHASEVYGGVNRQRIDRAGHLLNDYLQEAK